MNLKEFQAIELEQYYITKKKEIEQLSNKIALDVRKLKLLYEELFQITLEVKDREQVNVK